MYRVIGRLRAGESYRVAAPLDFINTHLISEIGDILGIVQLDFG